MNVGVENFLVIVGEVGLLLAVSLLLYWISAVFFKQLDNIPKLRSRRLKKIRQSINRILVLFWAVMTLLVLAGNGFLLVYQRKNLRPATQEILQQIPVEFWLALVVGTVKSALLLSVVAFSLRPLRNLLGEMSEFAQKVDQLDANDESVAEFFRAADANLGTILWLIALNFCAQFLQLSAGITRYLSAALVICIVIAVGVLTLKIAAVIVDTLDGLSVKYSSPNNLLRFYDRFNHLLPFLKRCLEMVIYVAMATLIVQQIELLVNLATQAPDLVTQGASVATQAPDAAAQGASAIVQGPKLSAQGSKVVKVIGVIFLSRVLVTVGHLGVEEVLLAHQKLTEIERKRRLTIVPLLQSFTRYFAYFGAGVWILDLIGINPTPILAGAGILALAVGLGAQNLINDIVSGFFILFETSYLVGDYIEIGEAEGVVEAIELRTTRIRHPSGKLFILRNGDIAEIVNYSKEYIYAVVDIGVAYDSDLNQVYEILEEVGRKFQQEHPDEVLEPTEIDGVEEFEDSKIVIRTLTKAKPNESRRGVHDDIQGDLRKSIKEAFEKAGIEIPFSQRIMWRYKSLKSASPPDEEIACD